MAARPFRPAGGPYTASKVLAELAGLWDQAVRQSGARGDLLTQKRLAGESRVPQTTLNSWATGTSLPRDLDQLVRVGQVLAMLADRDPLSTRRWEQLLSADQLARGSTRSSGVPEAREGHSMGLDKSEESPHYIQFPDGSLVRRRIPQPNVPPMPAHFADRKDVLARARTALLKPSSIEAGRVMGLVGMGGVGKSALARALARDEQVCRTFRDGIFWLELGPTPKLTSCQAQLAEAFGDSRPITDEQEGLSRLNTLLSGAACLVVLDNVWEQDDLRAFELLEPKSALLVTTRNQDILDLSAAVELIRTLPKEPSRRLLADWADQDHSLIPTEAEEVVEQCGGLPLALAIAGGMKATGHSWHNICERLRRAHLDKLVIKLPDYRKYRNLLRVLDASVSGLDEEQRDRFLELAVFEGRGNVPVEVVEWLWRQAGVDDLDLEDLRIWLTRRSLIQYDEVTRTITLHDLQFDYARHILGDQRLRELHASLAAAVLRGWGGLDDCLPALRTSPLLDPVDRYGILHLVSHLKDADNEEGIHRLLALNSHADTPNGSLVPIDNAWYSAHDRIGEAAAYSSDVSVAWNLARKSTDEASHRGELALSIGLEIRYALVEASIASIAANLPTQLPVALVESGYWAAEQGLAYARQIPVIEIRAKTLTYFLSFLNNTTHLLHDLAPLAAEAAAEALAAGRAVKDPNSRVEILTALAPQLPEPDRTAAVNEEWDAGRTTPASASRARALMALATKTKLPEPFRGQILATAYAFKDASSRANVLTALAPQLPESDRAKALISIQAAIRKISQPEARAAALTELIPQLPEPDQTEALRDAQAAIRTITNGGSRSAALTALASHLPKPHRAATLAQALADARAISDARLRATTFTSLMAHLPKSENMKTGREGRKALGTALADARASRDPGSRAIVQTILLSLVEDKAERRAVARAALNEAYEISDARDRAAVLITLVPEIPEPTRDIAIDEACAAACAIDDPDRRVDFLTTLAFKLPEAVRHQASSTARAIDVAFKRSEALATTLAYCELEVDDRLAILNKMLTVQAMDEAGFQTMVSEIEVVSQLPERKRLDVLSDGHAVTHAIREVYSRATALAVMTENLDRPTGAKWESDPANAIAEVCSKVNAFGVLALEFPDALQDQAMAAIDAINRARSWAKGNTVKSALPRPLHFTPIEQVLLYDAEPQDSFTTPGLNVTETQRAAARHRSLGAKPKGRPSRHADAPRDIAKHALTGPIPQWDPYWRAFIEGSATRGRIELISSLSVMGIVIFRLGGSPAVHESIQALLGVGRWWP